MGVVWSHHHLRYSYAHLSGGDEMKESFCLVWRRSLSSQKLYDWEVPKKNQPRAFTKTQENFSWRKSPKAMPPSLQEDFTLTHFCFALKMNERKNNETEHAILIKKVKYDKLRLA